MASLRRFPLVAFLVLVLVLALACGCKVPQSKCAVEVEGQVPPPEHDRDLSDPTAARFVPVDSPAPKGLEPGLAGDGIYLLRQDADSLVLLLTDKESGELRLVQPHVNQRNLWQFELPGEPLAPSDPRLGRLSKLPHEGFYRLTREMQFQGDGRWLVGAIVQLGYTREGEPITFIAQRLADEQNVLFFSDKGVKISHEQLEWLEPLAWYQADAPAAAE